MSGHFYKDQLYPLQDRALKVIAGTETSFYLTGGTLLSRFLFHHRYSDDIDLFLNYDPDFQAKTDVILSALKNSFKSIIPSIKQDSFVRIYIEEADIQLKVEFINDVNYRVGIPYKNAQGLWLDTWENVLSNKITALSRDLAKDVVDIVFLSQYYEFNWKEMIDHAKLKDTWVDEIEVSQLLMNFKMEKLEEVRFMEGVEGTVIKREYLEILAKESLHGFDNSLVKK